MKRTKVVHKYTEARVKLVIKSFCLYIVVASITGFLVRYISFEIGMVFFGTALFLLYWFIVCQSMKFQKKSNLGREEK